MTALVAENHHDLVEPSTELVPVSGDGLPTAADFARARAALTRLREQGDAESLHAASAEAHVYALYHQRQQHKAVANDFASLQILAEAGLGRIDLERSPRAATGGCSLKEPLVIAGEAIKNWTRTTWRVLAMGEIQGILSAVLSELQADDLGISTSLIVDYLQARGCGWVDPTPFQEAIRSSDLSQNEISRQSGIPRTSVNNIARQEQRVVRLETAIKIAPTLGIDLATLRPMPRPRSELSRAEAAARRRQREREAAALLRERRRNAAQRHGGNIAEAFSLLRRCAQVLDPAEHDFKTPEAKAHVRSAYAHLRQAEDEVAQALGVE